MSRILVRMTRAFLRKNQGVPAKAEGRPFGHPSEIAGPYVRRGLQMDSPLPGNPCQDA